VALASEGKVVASGLWFDGRPESGIRAWADLVVEDLSILPEVTEALGPGGSLMIAYEQDVTERALRRKVPPAATPVGLAMLAAGCRWFKDWYYPEGGREGGTKLQGTLPLNEESRKRAEAGLIQELKEFLARPDASKQDQDRARQALRFLGAATEGS
jgi:hypothetical protein